MNRKTENIARYLIYNLNIKNEKRVYLIHSFFIVVIFIVNDIFIFMKYKNILTEDLLKRMFIDEKKSSTEIAKELGLKKSTIENYLFYFKINRKSDTRRLNITKEMIEKELIVNGLTKEETCKKLGIVRQTLNKYIEFYGMELPVKDSKDKEIIELVKHLYVDEIKTTREITEILGWRNCGKVNRILRNNGVEIRPKGNIKGKEYHLVSPFKQEVENVDRMIELFNECMPVSEIARELNVGNKAVYRKIKELGLIRPKSMMSRPQYDGSIDSTIIEMYNNGASPQKIADELGLSRGSIRNHLKHCNVDVRGISKGIFNYHKKEFPKELEDFETLYDMYITQRLSKKEIGRLLNVAPHVVDRCLKSFDISVRGNSEARIGLFGGPNHPNWKGGRSGLYARLREYFRITQIGDVVKRDGKKCQMCGSTHKLHVHHIRPFKDIFEEILSEHKDLDVVENQEELFEIMKNDERLNDLDNLITYCKECHLFKVHGYKKKEQP